jgi:serine/threonine-protein kinase
MDQFDGKTLPGSEGGGFSIFSPAGDWIAFSTRDHKIKKMPVDGGASITLCAGGFEDGAAWGDDDTIVFPGPKGLLRVSASGGTPEALTTVNDAKGEIRHTRPQFLPGGRLLLFSVCSKEGDGPQFAVLDLQKGGYRTVAKGGDNGRYVPTGHLTFVRSGTLFAVPFDLGRLVVAGTEAPVIERVSGTGPIGTGDYAFSDTGVLAYSESLAQSGTVLTLMDRKGLVQKLPGQIPRQWGTGRLSPDGRRVANAIADDKNADIWVVDLTRGTPTRLTFGGQNDHPIWSPDGRRIVYGGTKDGKAGVYSVAADGSGQPELLAGTETDVTPTSFTPDGKTLLYSQNVASQPHVMVMPVAAPGVAAQTHRLRDGAAGADFDAQISPDGKWVALTSSESGRPEVYVLPFPGPGPKTPISSDGGQRPRWAPSGRELFYWTAGAGSSTLMSVPIQPIHFSAGVPQTVFTAFAGTTWDVSPDGNHFLVEAAGTPGTGSILATVTNWFDELRRRVPAKK